MRQNDGYSRGASPDATGIDAGAVAQWEAAASDSWRLAWLGLVGSVAALALAIVPIVIWRTTVDRWCPDLLLYPLVVTATVVATLGWRGRPHRPATTFDPGDERRRRRMRLASHACAIGSVVVLWTFTCPVIDTECDEGQPGVDDVDLARRCGFPAIPRDAEPVQLDDRVGPAPAPRPSPAPAPTPPAPPPLPAPQPAPAPVP